ncbi:MAG: SAM-dependent methyltransferase [Velocimicrobium sp.]
MEEILNYVNCILEDEIIKVVFSNCKNADVLYRKVTIQQKENYFQIEKFTQKQVFHENIPPEAMKQICMQFLEDAFMQMNAWGRSGEYSLKITKKGKVLFHKTPIKKELPQMKSHNRKKQHLLEEGIIIPPLVDMGVFTKEGNVVQSMYDKYKQINKFIEIVDDAIQKYDKKQINIVDFGCGKSYLTFVLYYYLKEVKHMDIQMTGLDLKEDVIRKCNETAKRYGYDCLRFEMGDISGYQSKTTVDMVVSLHACDTATDYALFNAITWSAAIIISVPCCQHEIAAQMTEDYLPIINRYGIVKERTAALMTDAIRCNLLTVCGYKTQLLEFVDLSHTPKNLLIRAVKSNITNEHKRIARKEVQDVSDAFQLRPTLLELLRDRIYEI